MAAVVAEIDISEEIIKQRVRENLKLLEELGISKDIREFAKREYKLWVGDTKDRYYRKRTSTNQNNAGREYTGRIVSDNQKAAAVKRAEELQRDLKSHYPSFIKAMVRSHVSGCFWLGLPFKFCNDNLPSGELRMTLEDEKGKEHDVLYLGRKNGLSGGWRGFSIDHSLEDGDVLVFELTQAARFKVHIVKALEEEKTEKSMTPKKKREPVSQKRPPKTGSGKQAGSAPKRGRRCIEN
ncbi:uncharacterized protein A4U43_C01F960 [Asparagus officinalis]|uniref:TF-B3 domain-containing protein n=1 Tax=Asparagus officinalis TaxID=4686 RepID=A0A5P1FKR6_ASPOF|nr:B3 domain-containing protein Os05g0481400-like [Asparagus officinalis]ONK78915.1 uncharacterized protein A4U43_C01F960 [Asparagus officinalis]